MSGSRNGGQSTGRILWYDNKCFNINSSVRFSLYLNVHLNSGLRTRPGVPRHIVEAVNPDPGSCRHV